MMINNREDKNGKPCYERAFCIRMKSTLTKRGCHFKVCGSIKLVITVTFLMRPISSVTVVWIPRGAAPGPAEASVFISTHQEVQHSDHGIYWSGNCSASSLRSWSQTWDRHVCHQAFFWLQNCPLWSKVSPRKNMKKKLGNIHIFFHRVADLLDYSADDLTGKSLYALCHGGDVDKIKQTHTDRKFIFFCFWSVFLYSLCSDQERSSDVNLYPIPEPTWRLHVDADVRHVGLQHQERERAVDHLRELRPERVPVQPRGHGPGAGGPAHGQDQAWHRRRLRGGPGSHRVTWQL